MTATTGGARVVGGRYRLLARLGGGSTGTVWRAEDLLLGRRVAVKEVVLPPGTRPEDAEVLRERTRREARAAAALDHPSAVTVFDVVEEDGRPWLVLELVEARTLAEAVVADGPLPPARAAQVGLALLGALEAAHRRGIVHRDVKPGNVLLTDGREEAPGRVVLTDFGIATSAGEATLTGTGLLLGSPAYIAPERARGGAPGPASDLWSLGATLYTAVEGRPAFDEGGDALRTVTAVVRGTPAPYVLAGPLEPVLDGLLHKDPAQRLTAAAARAALRPVADGRLSAPARPAPAPAPRALQDDTAAMPAPDLSGAAPPAPAVARRRPSARTWSAAAVAVVAAGSTVALLPHGAPARRPVAAPSSPAPAPATPSPRPPAPAVPAGWTAFHSPAGWALAVPADWVRSDYRGQVQFRDQAHRRTLRLGQATGSGALGAATAAAPSYAQVLDGYRQLRLATVPYRGLDAADLEFTYTSQATALHVLDRTVATGGATAALWWQTPADDFRGSLSVFEQVAATFVPAPVT